MTLFKNGCVIQTLDEWRDLAGPKSLTHWKPGRSAMEVARAWLGVASPALPVEVAAVLSSNPAFGGIVSWNAEPEVRLPFDQYRGEPRNTDLLVQARDDYGDFLLAVEAKGDEPFGETVAQALAAAAERKRVNPRSRGIERIEQLIAALCGSEDTSRISLNQLRYQLLTATAGAIAEAVRNQRQRTVLLIQEFHTDQTSDAKHLANERDLNTFINQLSRGAISQIESGTIHGPFKIAEGPLFGKAPPFFIGKATRNIRAVQSL